MNEIFEDDYPVKDRCPDCESPSCVCTPPNPIPKRNHSLRAEDWQNFSMKVFTHIETYTIPQYGDRGTDQCSEFSLQDFITQIRKYGNRFGRNSRPGQDKLDLLKIAHYAQMAYDCLSSSNPYED